MNKSPKLLFVLLPFWTPLIPPMGIATLKSYLEKTGVDSTIKDANVDYTYRIIYDEYFQKLKEFVPEFNRGNFYSIGTDVFRNHLMAHINYNNIDEYKKLVSVLVAKTYFIKSPEKLIDDLIKIVENFYIWLSGYLDEIVSNESPDVIGLSVYKDILPAAIFSFKYIKNKYSEIKTIMGGSIFSEQLPVNSPDYNFFIEKTDKYIDAIFIGRSEILISKYLKGELSNEKKVFITNDYKQYTPDINDLDLLPDYSDFSVKQYPFIGVLGSTGCFYNCSFCNVVTFFGEYQQRKVSHIVKEMLFLNEKYGSQLFFMGDNMINSYINEFAEETYKQKTALYWSAYMRADTNGCDEKTVIKWRKGGLYSARIGIDSASQKILDLMDKQINPEMCKKVLATMASAGIKTTAYWLIGHPYETEEDFQETLDFISENKDNMWEAECEYYNYYYSGQSHSDKYASLRTLVYPEKYKEMLLLDKWQINTDPSREVIFNRVFRFVEHCKKLGIPNTYSLNEIKYADERWKILHPNSVPSLLEFSYGDSLVDDRENVKDYKAAKSVILEQGDFNI